MNTASFEDLLTACTVAVAAPGREGSGFFVAPGLVVTAAHVVPSSASCSVTWDEELYPATVLARFPDVAVTSGLYPAPDVAVLKVANASGHPCVELDRTTPRFGEYGDSLFAAGYTRRYTAERLTLTPLLTKVRECSASTTRILCSSVRASSCPA